MVYRAYRPDKGWYVVEILKIAGVCILVTYLFYNNVFFLPFTTPLVPALWRIDKAKYEAEKKHRLREEFKDIIVTLSGNLNVGYSLENAFIRTRLDMQKLYCGGYLLEDEFSLIVNGLSCNRRLEDMLLELGKKSGIEEISECAGLLVTAKEYGGSMIKIIHQIAGNLTERLSVELEIDTAVSAKRLEGNIMLAMPFAIILYMRIMNRDYISILYQTPSGRIVMTIALLITIIAAIWSNRIIRIEV